MNEPAFPHVRVASEQYSGITIRDYFAAAALTGMMSNENVYQYMTDQQVAVQSHSLADAMLEARKPKAEPEKPSCPVAHTTENASRFMEPMTSDGVTSYHCGACGKYWPDSQKPKAPLAAGLEQYKRDTALFA